jgi:hypothetical protein
MADEAVQLQSSDDMAGGIDYHEAHCTQSNWMKFNN